MLTNNKHNLANAEVNLMKNNKHLLTFDIANVFIVFCTAYFVKCPVMAITIMT